MKKPRWHVYLVRCADGTLYAGITTDLRRRIAMHNAAKGAKYTRARRPVTLVWSRPAASEGAARRREYRIRHLPKKEKEALVAATH